MLPYLKPLKYQVQDGTGSSMIEIIIKKTNARIKSDAEKDQELF